ncbi:MAG: hypothetical protein V1721_07725 [Pseudomonadota bacterium]
MLQKIGNILRSISGWWWVGTVPLPTAATFIGGIYEGIGIAASITFTMATLAFGVIMTYYGHLLYDSLLPDRSPKPIVAILKKLEKMGCNFLDDSHQIIFFAQEVRQAALDGGVAVWGKNPKYQCEDLNKSEPLLQIPLDHWKDNKLDAISCVMCGSLDGKIIGIKMDNFQVRSYAGGSQKTGFVDVRLVSNNKWLKNVTRKISNLEDARKHEES